MVNFYIFIFIFHVLSAHFVHAKLLPNIGKALYQFTLITEYGVDKIVRVG